MILGNANDLIAALAEVQQEVGNAGGTILKMDRTGAWVYGTESTEVEDGSEWAIDPRSYMRGVIAWGDGEVLSEHMALVTDPLPDYGPAPADAEKGWQKQLGFMLKCISGEDEGVEARYMTVSAGGLKAVGALSNALRTQLRENPAEPIAVVTLGAKHYAHKKFGKIYTPEFKLVRWASPETMSKGALPEATEPEAAEPERRRRRA